MAFYAELLAKLKKGALERRATSWMISEIENRPGTRTVYISMGRDLIRFMEWLEGQASMEALDDVQQGSILFLVGGE